MLSSQIEGTQATLMDLLEYEAESDAPRRTRASTTKPTAGRAIAALEATGVLVETTGEKRDRVYAYQAYLDRLRAGTELGDEG